MDPGGEVMSEYEVNEINSPHDAEATSATESPWAVSLAFWSSLLLASAAYAAVALAPKFSQWIQVRTQYVQNAHQLIALENDVNYLERVDDALQKDPRFVQRLVQARQADRPTAGESIPVSGDLMFGSVTTPQVVMDPPQPGKLESAATFLATDQDVRQILILFAAGMTIFGFTFLNDSGQGLVQGAVRITRSALLIPLRRYQKTSESPEPRRSSSSDSDDIASVPDAHS